MTECTGVHFCHTHRHTHTHTFLLKTLWCDLVWLLKVTLNINGVYSRRAHHGVHLCSGRGQKNDAITAEAGSSMPHSTAAHRKFISCKRKHSVSSPGNVKNEPGTGNLFHGSCGESSPPVYSWNFLQTYYSPHFSAFDQLCFSACQDVSGFRSEFCWAEYRFPGQPRQPLTGIKAAKATVAWSKYVWKRTQTSPVTNIIEPPASVEKKHGTKKRRGSERGGLSGPESL